MTLRRYVLAVEGAVSLSVARAALLCVPFRRVVAWTTRPLNGRPAAATGRARAIAEVRWAIAAAGARLPGRTSCLPRALAAQAMLRRRRIATTISCGARLRNGFDAHAWLTAGDAEIVGCGAAPDYSAITAFTNETAVGQAIGT